MCRILPMCILFACSSDSSKSDSSVDLYRTCDIADDCTDHPESADASCLDKGGEGFCTWTCTTDDDCITNDDELWTLVCASFESEEDMFCFPACNEGADEAGSQECPGTLDCRSTGGGSDNQKVCFPTDRDATP